MVADVKFDNDNGGPSEAFQSKNDGFTLALRKSRLADELPASLLSTEDLYLDREPVIYDRLAQFQLPKHKEQMYRQKGKDPPSPLSRYLQFEYSYGSESEISYRQDADLNNQVKDNLLLLLPELNGFLTYRPTEWLEATVEMIFAVEIPAIGQGNVTLPNGDTQFVEGTSVSLIVDQAFVTLKEVIDPFALTLGRRNFEDDRHWLYDESLDVGLLSLGWKKWYAEASVGRAAFTSWDLTNSEDTDRINNYILYAEHRGVEDIKFAGYTVVRDDRDDEEGTPVLIGVRSLGNPSRSFSYWADLAYLTGKDASSRRFSAVGVDFGGTYRFTSLPFVPNITMGFAYGSGNNPTDSTNHEFRQTGLQSNEARFAGVSEFKVYGEALDPELSNLLILTAGVGFRPMRDISVDLVYHRYWLDQFAEELRNSPITALMNQDPTRLSKDVGDAFDVVVGFRNIFGLRRLGIDFRLGWFFPGKAFLIDEGDDKFRKANSGLSMVTKFWW